MNNRRLSDITDALMTARDTGGLMNPPSKHFKNFDLEAGYQIGADLHRRMSEGKTPWAVLSWRWDTWGMCWRIKRVRIRFAQER
jgi:hypothetical protein